MSYERDFFEWSQYASEALLKGCLAEVDLQQVAEEIRDLGIAQKRELYSRLSERHELESLFHFNPSLLRQVPETLIAAYPAAVAGAMKNTGLPRKAFPADCPFSACEVTTG